MRIAVIADLPLKTGNTTYNTNILYNIINDMIVNENADVILFPAANLTAPCPGSLAKHPQFLDDIENAFSSLKLVGMGDILFNINTFRKNAKTGIIQNVSVCVHGGSECAESFVPQEGIKSEDYPGFLFKANLKGDSDSLVFCPTAIPFHKANAKKLDEYAIERSKHTKGIFLLVNGGYFESTSGAIYLPQIVLAKNGKIIESKHNPSEPYLFNIDLPGFADCSILARSFPSIRSNYSMLANSALPFCEMNEDELIEIFEAQVNALSGRFAATHAEKLVVGISGGLDSTLALLASATAVTAENVIAISMPGFGTTCRTKNNAAELGRMLSNDYREINITKACKQHFRDIGHDQNKTDVVFENTQARERTQILMDIANQVNGLVVGTGDLSELALGWCTYNGDHMSMYAVNSTIPKTLVRAIVAACANRVPDLGSLLRDILDTPVSPELLPVSANAIESEQKTEAILGSYELHDFFLFHLISLQEGPEQIYKAAKKIFAGKYSNAEIKRTLKLFFRRFFSQQFKRSCMPDAPQVTPVSLAARDGWYMPADTDSDIWTEILESL